MRNLTYLLLIAILLFTSCGDNKYEKMRKESDAFLSQVSGNVKEAMSGYKTNSLGYLSKPSISGNFYCLEYKEGKFSVYGDLNYVLRENGNDCNYQRTINYLVVVERIVHIVGEYTNGGDAKQIETKVYLVDVNNFSKVRLFQNMGKEPPESVRGRPGTKNGGTGQYMHGKEIYNELISYVQ